MINSLYGSICVLIQRDAKNIPFAKVLYDYKSSGYQDAFNLDEDTKNFASYVARKSITENGIVYISTIDQKELTKKELIEQRDSYYISGCESGVENVKNLVRRISNAATDLDIDVPLYVTDGQMEQPINYNEFDRLANKGVYTKEAAFKTYEENFKILRGILGEEPESQEIKPKL